MAKDTTAWRDEHSPAADPGKVGAETTSDAAQSAADRSQPSEDPFASLLEAAVWDAIAQPVSAAPSLQDADDEPAEPGDDALSPQAPDGMQEEFERRIASKQRVIGLILEASVPPGVRSRAWAMKSLHAIWQEIGFAGPSTRQLWEDYMAARKAFWAAERAERESKAADKDALQEPPQSDKPPRPRGTGAA